MITDANGLPLAATLTGANRHDVTQLIPLVDGIVPVQGRRGRPIHRPLIVQGDRAYGSKKHKIQLKQRGIKLQAARPGDPHGSGLGKTRWPVERTLSWLHQFKRLRVRYEWRADIHQAFVTLAMACICFRKYSKIALC